MPRSLNARGALLMAFSMLAFVLNDGLMKGLLAEMSIYQAVVLRGSVTAPLIALMAWRAGVLIVKLKGRDKKIILARVAAEVVATICFLTALGQMPLANITAILQALPLTVTMAAALFLAEPVGWRRWSAILMGLCGVLVIVQPGMDDFSIHSLWALAAVIAVTCREIATRQLSKDVPSLPVALATAIAICGFGAVNLPGVDWVTVTLSSWVYIGGAGVAIIGGYLFSVMAVRAGDISFVSPFRYTAMIWAIGLGFLLFGELPDVPTTIGTLIIITAGLYSLHRERRRAAENA